MSDGLQYEDDKLKRYGQASAANVFVAQDLYVEESPRFVRRVPVVFSSVGELASATAADWMTSVETQLEALGCLEAGWNPEADALAMTATAVQRVQEVLNDIMRSTTPPPSVVPTRDGGLQLEWHLKGVDLEVEVSPDRKVGFTIEEVSTGEEVVGSLPAEAKQLDNIIAQLTAA